MNQEILLAVIYVIAAFLSITSLILYVKQHKYIVLIIRISCFTTLIALIFAIIFSNSETLKCIWAFNFFVSLLNVATINTNREE